MQFKMYNNINDKIFLSVTKYSLYLLKSIPKNAEGN